MSILLVSPFPRSQAPSTMGGADCCFCRLRTFRVVSIGLFTYHPAFNSLAIAGFTQGMSFSFQSESCSATAFDDYVDLWTNLK